MTTRVTAKAVLRRFHHNNCFLILVTTRVTAKAVLRQNNLLLKCFHKTTRVTAKAVLRHIEKKFKLFNIKRPQELLLRRY